MAKAAAVAKSALPTHGLLQGVKIMFPLTPPKHDLPHLGRIGRRSRSGSLPGLYGGAAAAIIPRWWVLAATNRLSSARCRFEGA
jgi:hypothetical protein